MKTISKIELALATSLMPFAAQSEPADADLRLIEKYFSMGDSVESICSCLDELEGLRHVRIPVTKVYSCESAAACPVIPLFPEKLSSHVEGSCLRLNSALY